MADSPQRLLLAQYGEFLASRILGADARAIVEAAVRAGERVVVDFAGIDGISLSFADELAGKLVLAIGLPAVREHVRFANATPSIARLLQAAIRNRTHQAPPDAA